MSSTETSRLPRSGPEVVTFGEVMTALLGPAAVPLRAAATLSVTLAGAEANVAIGLARLGHTVAYVTRLGADPLGRRLGATLAAEGVDTRYLRFDSERPTGLLVRDVHAERPTTVLYHRTGSAATALSPDDIDDELIRGARLVHITGITAALSDSGFDACRHAARMARAAGATVCFDPNVRLRLAAPERWAAIVSTLAEMADVVLCGHEDATVAIPSADPCGWLGERGVSTVVFKQGAMGASEHSADGVSRGSALDVHALDPVGAGDAFAAGWISAWLRGAGPDCRLAEAAAVAACCVMSVGDVDGLPDAATRDALLEGQAVVDR